MQDAEQNYLQPNLNEYNHPTNQGHEGTASIRSNVGSIGYGTQPALSGYNAISNPASSYDGCSSTGGSRSERSQQRKNQRPDGHVVNEKAKKRKSRGQA